MAEQPTVVLVHGAFAESASWDVFALQSWFVHGDEDLDVPVARHRFTAERAGPMGTTEVAGGSHAISVSHPRTVVDTILEAVAGVGISRVIDVSLP
jgi:pimeloyl-ACP methyl ester carboxylesterase